MSDVNYRFTENGIEYEFDDVFVPADIFRQPALWSWGLNSSGQLGINATTDRSTPVTTILGGTNWKSIVGGGYHTVAIKTDGTLWLWGSNNKGQLGINTTTNRSTPVTTILGGNNWKQVSAGYFHTTAVKNDGTLWVWGGNTDASDNPTGQLGIFSTTNRSIPVTTILGGTDWKSVAGGYLHTASIKTDGTLWLWGKNGYGLLGINDGDFTLIRSTPITTILGGFWRSVSCGKTHIGAIKSNGTLWNWGSTFYAQLGNNTYSLSGSVNSPITTFVGGTTWKSISCSGYFSSAVKTDGTLWTWGWCGNGELGVNYSNSIWPPDILTPVTTILGGTNWKSCGNGPRYGTAIKTDGTLWTWGANSNAQLGVNDTNDRSTPITTLLRINYWKSSSGGNKHAIAIQYVPDP